MSKYASGQKIQLVNLIMVSFIFSLLSACGGSGGTSQNSHVEPSKDYSGVAQKGPFEVNTPVVISQLDALGLPTGNSIRTKIEDANGRFSYDLPKSWGNAALQIKVDGYYLDEATGTRSKHKIHLRTITDDPKQSSINLATNWLAKRTEALLNKKLSLTQSLQKSEKELNNIFGIRFSRKLDLSQFNKQSSDNALTLLLSGALSEVAQRQQIKSQKIVNEIAADFADDGKLTQLGNDWFRRMQAKVRDNPQAHINHYAQVLKDKLKLHPPLGKHLPKIVPLVSRPVVVVSTEIIAEPGSTIVLDGSASHANGGLHNFTWFRVDQQTQHKIPFSDRFSATPEITLPNQEVDLLFALMVTGVDKLTDTGVVRVSVKASTTTNNRPIALDQAVITPEDQAKDIVLEGSDQDVADTLSYDLVSPTLILNGLLEGTPPNVKYIPNDNFNGSDSFKFTVNDGKESSLAANVDISVTAVNDPPVAVIKTPDTAFTHAKIKLDGSGSSDIDGTIEHYSWVVPNSSVPLTGVSSSFLAPATAGEITVKLTVEDNVGATGSITKKILITAPISTPPIANAGTNQTEVYTGDTNTIALDGSQSRDPDGAQNGSDLTYSWSVISTSPATTIDLVDANTSKPSFTVSAPVTAVIKLTVTDTDNLKHSDEVTVVIQPAPNNLPIANPVSLFLNQGDSVIDVPLSGSDADAGDTVTVVANSVTDPAHGTLTQAGGSYTYSPNSDYFGVDTFTYKVTDSKAESLDAATVTLNINGRPVASAGNPQSVPSIMSYFSSGSLQATQIVLDGTGIDPENASTELQYQWVQLGSDPVDVGPIASIAKPTINIPEAPVQASDFNRVITGEYTFQLIVTDKNTNPSALSSVPSTVVITVLKPGTLPPVAVADASPNPALVGNTITLDASSSSDPDGDPLTYLWTQTAGTPVALNATAVKPTFVAPSVGQPTDFIFTLVVHDGTVSSSTKSVTVKINPIPLPTADAGYDSNVSVGAEVNLDGSMSIETTGYQWTFTQKPANSLAILVNANTATPSFTADVAGLYVIQLVATNGYSVATSTDTVSIVSGNAMTLTLVDNVIGVGRTTTATLTLSYPAPVGGLLSELNIDNAIAGLSRYALQFAEGETQKTVTINGVSVGNTVLTATATNVPMVSADIEVTQSLISINLIPSVAPGEATSVVISISKPAPAGGLTIHLTTADPALATVSPATIFIPAGAVTPSQNAQITGVDFGTVGIRASAAGYATDTREVLVALTADFVVSSLVTPVTQTRTLVIELDSPAPAGGVTFSFAAKDAGIFEVPPPITIPVGQTKSNLINIKGLEVGKTNIIASAPHFVDFDARIEVKALPLAFLSKSHTSYYFEEAIIGLQLQARYHVTLSAAPLRPIDIKISVPPNSGILLSKDIHQVGTDKIEFKNLLSGSPYFAIQGLKLGDDVPITIEVLEHNTTQAAPFAVKDSTVDVDPAGLYVNPSDYTTTSFSENQSNITVHTIVLYDDETPAKQGQYFTAQPLRAGFDLDVPMESSDPSIVSLPLNNGIVSIHGAQSSARTDADPHAKGTAILSIKKPLPADFAVPITTNSNYHDNVVVTVEAAKAYISRSRAYLKEVEVGKNLMKSVNIRFKEKLPVSADVIITVPNNQGVLLSKDKTTAAVTQITLEDIPVGRNHSPNFYIHGIALGDDVPITVEIVKANTSTPMGYDILPSTVDVDPAGIYLEMSDYSTTTFSSERSFRVKVGMLYDEEYPAKVGEFRNAEPQVLRAGFNLNLPMKNSNPNVVSINNNSTVSIIAGASTGEGKINPKTAGVATVSIETLPAGFNLPSNSGNYYDNELVVTVTAAKAFISHIHTNAHYKEVIVGQSLMTTATIGWEQGPVEPIDVKVSIPPAGSGVLLSKDKNTVGVTSLVFEDVPAGTYFRPSIYVQGLILGDDVPFKLEVFKANTTTPVGYDILPSTIDVDPAGLYVNTSNYSTSTFSDNRKVDVTVALLYDNEGPGTEGNHREDQLLRPGFTLEVPMVSNHPNVVGLPENNGLITIEPATKSGSTGTDPLTAGEATLSIASMPGGFSLPADYRDDNVVVTVTAPNTLLSYGSSSNPTHQVNVGDELQQKTSVWLEETPPNPVDVKIEVVSSSVALISKDPTQQGSKSITFSAVTDKQVGDIYIQGLQLLGATQLRITAAGYEDWLVDINVSYSGFELSGYSSLNVGQKGNLTIRSVRFDQVNAGHQSRYQQVVRGGQSYSFDITTSKPSVATYETPIVLNANETQVQSKITGEASGITTLSITQPAGFTAPYRGVETELTVH